MATAKKKYKSYYKPKSKKAKAELSPDVLVQLRNDILRELKDDKVRGEQEAARVRAEGDAVRAKFVKEMKASSEPWVDILMWVNTPTGVKYELDWNDAFIRDLETNGIKGVDEEQTIQKWVAILVRRTADTMDEVLSDVDDSKFE